MEDVEKAVERVLEEHATWHVEVLPSVPGLSIALRVKCGCRATVLQSSGPVSEDEIYAAWGEHTEGFVDRVYDDYYEEDEDDFILVDVD